MWQKVVVFEIRNHAEMYECLRSKICKYERGTNVIVTRITAHKEGNTYVWDSE